jgi:hypothetical protein
MVVAVVTVAGCADSGTTQARQEPTTRLTVTSHTEAAADESATPSVWELTCDPPGCTHPNPAAACQALAEAKDPFATPPADEICAEIYGGPQRARIEGTWRGDPVQAEFSRSNGCEIARWDALRAVLQP